MLKEAKEMLIKHEGVRTYPYFCSENYLTIGAGRNLKVNGISEEEAMYLLDNDIDRVINNLDKVFPAWKVMPKKARLVCIDMAYQLGIQGFMNFRRTRTLMEMGCWLEASEEIYALVTQIRLHQDVHTTHDSLPYANKNSPRPSKQLQTRSLFRITG